ncbi:putative acid phosphatase [Yarrowia sp. B02]|nr:putative acid phosphatase [Yarrowia sp. B02]
MKFSSLTLFAVSLLFSSAEAKKNKHQPAMTTISPNLSEIAAAQATAVSNQYSAPAVPGCAFDKYYQIWLENTDYEKAFEQEDMAWLRGQGITLTNYWALTHPSEPNYVAAVGGDYFGINNDDFFRVPENVFTVADLLDIKGISWAEYQEHQPYTGFQGMNFSRQNDLAPDYVRKHNPLVHYDSVVNVPERLGNLKNFTEFSKDVSNARLPQWAFITPNMTNDAHDTDIEFAGKWTRGFLEPLLANEEFMKDNLIIVTFDEVETYPLENKVLAVLLGGAVPKELHGTSDGTYYSHYSNLATVQANWQLPHLGRGDAKANPFKFVADQLNIPVVDFDTTGQYNNKSVKGYFNDERVPIPAPNASAIGVVGNTIFQKIADVWGGEVPAVATPSTCPNKTPVSAESSSTTSVDKSTSIAGEYVTVSSDCSSSANATVAATSDVASSSASPVFANTTLAVATTIEGEYVTVYVTDCPVTTVGPNGDVTTQLVHSTVTETVCPKCTKSKTVETPVASKPVESKPVAPVESKPVASKPVESPAQSKPVESSPKPTPVESKPAESNTTVTINKTVTQTQATSSPSSPAQAPQSTPAQANGAAKAVVGAAAAIPALIALF